MKITNLTIEEFTVFERAEFSFSPGLNVLIGTNGTGKSHVMKAVYACLKAWRAADTKNGDQVDGYLLTTKIRESLASVFKPADSDHDRLVRVPREGKQALLKLETDQGRIRTRWGKGATLSTGPVNRAEFPSPIFIPTSDAVATYEGFIAAYEARELAFDETYRDLCVALSANPLKKVVPAELAELIKQLRKTTGGSLKLTGNRFYLDSEKDGGKIEAHLVAEGFRKLGCLDLLLRNGSLSAESILFWDEPEGSLNPTLVSRVATTLMQLASAGMQVFIATHDYLLTNELSVAAEYESELAKSAGLRFHGLYRDDAGGPACVQQGAVLADIEHNPILDEFARHYDNERDLFYADEKTDRLSGSAALSIEFEEEGLRFVFDSDQWRVLKYDDDGYYRRYLEKLKDTKAIDFIGV
jgi:hypothetical protein